MLAISMVHYYNFCRKHKTLKGDTPAMAAGPHVLPLDRE